MLLVVAVDSREGQKSPRGAQAYLREAILFGQLIIIARKRRWAAVQEKKLFATRLSR
jgi:hypothetical protein